MSFQKKKPRKEERKQITTGRKAEKEKKRNESRNKKQGWVKARIGMPSREREGPLRHPRNYFVLGFTCLTQGAGGGWGV